MYYAQKNYKYDDESFVKEKEIKMKFFLIVIYVYIYIIIINRYIVN